MLQTAIQHSYIWCKLAQPRCSAKAAQAVLSTATLSFHDGAKKIKSKLEIQGLHSGYFIPKK